MPSFSTLAHRCGGKTLMRLLALLLALAVAAPVLLAQDSDHDRDVDHGRFVDPIVGSWIIHVTVEAFSPTPNPPPPFNLSSTTSPPLHPMASPSTQTFPLELAMASEKKLMGSITQKS